MRQASIAITAAIVGVIVCLNGWVLTDTRAQSDPGKQGEASQPLGNPIKTTGNPGFGNSAFVSERALNLLLLRDVVRDLQVDEDQATRAKELATWRDRRIQPVEARNRHADGLARDKTKKLDQELDRLFRQELAEILRPSQLRRLMQISRQQGGAMTLLDPEVEKELRLGDDQKNRIRSILIDRHQEGTRILKQHEGTKSSPEAQLKALRNQTHSLCTNVLTEEQIKSWTTMLGDPYVFQSQPSS